MNKGQAGKLLILGCKTLREGVIAALVFLLAGVALTLISVHVMPHVWHIQHIVMLAGFIMLLLAPVILVSTFLLSVLPNARENLEKCDR